MILRSPTKDEKSEFVMPAWMAGIQVRKDASGDVHVGLDSSAPCWNDGIERPLRSFERTPLVNDAIFSKKATKNTKFELVSF